ncbi:MAG: PRC-barrel domain-containing protein [Rhodospirillaceae bacterium]
MRTLYAAALGAALVIPGVAFAQSSTTEPTPGASTSPSMTSPSTSGAAESPSSPSLSSPDTAASGSLSSDQTAAMGAGEGHEVIGKTLKSAQGEELGEISNVLVDSQGQVAGLVVDAQEGDKKVKLEWQQVTMNPQGEIEASMQASELAELPEYQESEAGGASGASGSTTTMPTPAR